MKCYFPVQLPPKIFWVRKTAEDRAVNYTPYPRIYDLPKPYWCVLFQHSLYLIPDVYLLLHDSSCASENQSSECLTLACLIYSCWLPTFTIFNAALFRHYYPTLFQQKEEKKNMRTIYHERATSTHTLSEKTKYTLSEKTAGRDPIVLRKRTSKRTAVSN